MAPNEKDGDEIDHDGKVMLSARIDPGLRRRLHHLAIDEDSTVQELLRRIIEDYLDRHDAPKGPEGGTER